MTFTIDLQGEQFRIDSAIQYKCSWYSLGFLQTCSGWNNKGYPILYHIYTSRENSLELTEQSNINKVSIV